MGLGILVGFLHRIDDNLTVGIRDREGTRRL